MSSFHNTSLFFFLPSYMLPCLACFLWLLHRALHPISTIVVTPTIDAYSRLLTPSPFAPTCLLPLTSGIASCSYILAPTYLLPLTCSHLLSPSLPTFTIITCSSISPAFAYFTAYFCHRHLFLHASAYFIICFRHRHLLSHAFAIIAYSCLLPPLPLAYSHFRCLFPPSSIIVTSLGTSHISTYFVGCLPILIDDMF